MGFFESLALLLVGGGIVYLLFNNYRHFKENNHEKTTPAMWQSALLPISFVIIFVIFLIFLIR
ncbi:MAG: hypothetical protein DRQ51_05090 [Gammaproteobacteria bacterium]|nr:MAG: hypothetical protein DRQ51_05090 [Gammaproteobacteria bacterium]